MENKIKKNIFSRALDNSKNVVNKVASFANVGKGKKLFKNSPESEFEKLDTLIFYDREDIAQALYSAGFDANIGKNYHVLYSLSEKITDYRVISITKFIESGNYMFIPSDFRENIELLDSKGTIIVSFTPGVGNQELLIDPSSMVAGIRKSDPKNKGIN